MSRPVPWRRWDTVLAVVAFGFLAAVRAGTLDERDPYWQTRAGLENLDGAPLTRPDSWSWAPVDRMFTQTSPWWNDVLGAAWRVAGFAGFFTAGFVSILAYGLVVLLLARRLGARPLPALAGALVPVLLALPFLSPRGALTAQTLFLVALAVAHAAAPRLVVLRPLVGFATLAVGGLLTAALGIRLHLSWVVLAPALAGCVATVLLLTPALPRIRAVLLTGGLASGLAAGVLTGPYGSQVVTLSRQVQTATTGVVVEWLPTWTPGLWPRWLPTAGVALVGAAGIAWWLWRHRSERGDPRFGLATALVVLALPTAVAGFATIRVVGLALLTLAPLAAAGATTVVDTLRARSATRTTGPLAHPRVRHWMTGTPWRVVVTAVLVLVSPLVLLLAAPLGRPAEAAAMDALPRDCRLVSDANAAGAALLLRPDVTVWIDTRADYWGATRNAEALRLVFDGLDRTGVLQQANCALLTPDKGRTPEGLAKRLDGASAWAERYNKAGVRVWVRK